MHKNIPSESISSPTIKDVVKPTDWISNFDLLTDSSIIDKDFIKKIPSEHHLELAKTLIKKDHTKFFELWSEFHDLDEKEIIDSVFENNKGLYINFFADRLSSGGISYLIEKDLESKKFTYITNHLRKFDQLNWPQILGQMINHPDEMGKWEVLRKFDQDFLLELDDASIGKLNSFLAAKINKMDDYFQYYEYIKKLPWLNDEIAQKMINIAKLNPANVFLDKFRNLSIGSVQAIAKVLKPSELISHSDKFNKRSCDFLEKEYSLFSCNKDIGGVTKNILSEYHRIKTSGDQILFTGFKNKIKNLKEKLTSGANQDKNITSTEFYQDIVELCYGNNSSYTNYASNESCPDRSYDLEQFKIRPSYDITLLPSCEMVLKNGTSLDRLKLSTINQMIEQSRSKIFSRSKEQTNKINEKYSTPEANIVSQIITSYLAHNKQYATDIKQTIIDYQFANYPGINEFMDATGDQIKNSPSPDYYFLINLREFFVDRLKDTKKEIISKAFTDEKLLADLPDYYSSLKNIQENRKKKPKVNLEDNLFQILINTLNNPESEMFDENGKLIIDSKKLQTIKSIMRKNAQTVELIESRIKNIENTNDAPIVDKNVNIFNQELFAEYLSELLNNIYTDEISFIDSELAKFTPKDNGVYQHKIYKLAGHITKNHISAHVRGVAGLCISGDNQIDFHGKPQEKCLWNMPNYLQMELIDTESRKCQGLVLLHYFVENGQKTVIASFNPSSTYLFKVNEQELFDKLIEQLIIFAEDNDIDQIVISQNEHMRTNRTGGEFEQAILSRIKTMNETYKFSNPIRFSYKPDYQGQDMDIIWKNKKIKN